jgi:hypothetical protein
LPTLGADRAVAGRIRAVPDAALLKADRLIVRQDLLRSPVARLAQRAYEAWLRGYWHLLTKTVLA